jgi:hypothetical protein
MADIADGFYVAGLADLTELDLPSTMKTNFPDPADLLNFTLTITPDEGMDIISLCWLHKPHPCPYWPVDTGMYKGGAFVFSFVINTNYPHDPPKVKCTQKVIIYFSPKTISQLIHVVMLDRSIIQTLILRGMYA